MAGTRRKPVKRTVKPGKNIVESMAEGFRNKLVKIVNEGIKELVIDFNGVETVDSVGLGIILATHNSMEKSGGKLKISNMSGDIFKLSKTLGLDNQLDISAAA